MASALLLPLISVATVAAKPGNCSSYESKYSHCLPDETRSKFDRYIDRVPVKEWRWAPDAAYDAFKRIKYGVRIHWGLYSIPDTWGGDVAGCESWPFLSYNDSFRNRYQELYKTWNPTKFDANHWMDFFERAGFKMLAFTTKHHEGFSMFNTSTVVEQRYDWEADKAVPFGKHYSIVETPFGRDVVREIADAARGKDMKLDLYFSHPDWNDVDFRPYGNHPLQVPASCELLDTYCETCKPECQNYGAPKCRNFTNPTESSVARMMARHRAQLLELVRNYAPVDMLSLDIQLGGPVWPQLRETMLKVREAAPNVMIRARGIGNYGDYFTPERFVPGDKESTDEPWFVIYPLASCFSYDPNATNYQGPKWIVDNLADTIAKGGNFMLGIGPDSQGAFHPAAIQQVLDAGSWVQVNSEAIYDSVPRSDGVYNETKTVDLRFAQAERGNTIYAIAREWPGAQLQLETVRGVVGRTRVSMLGAQAGPDFWLDWENQAQGGGMTIRLPSSMQDPAKRPCKYAWTFKIEDPTNVRV